MCATGAQLDNSTTDATMRRNFSLVNVRAMYNIRHLSNIIRLVRQRRHNSAGLKNEGRRRISTLVTRNLRRLNNRANVNLRTGTRRNRLTRINIRVRKIMTRRFLLIRRYILGLLSNQFKRNRKSIHDTSKYTNLRSRIRIRTNNNRLNRRLNNRAQLIQRTARNNRHLKAVINGTKGRQYLKTRIERRITRKFHFFFDRILPYLT